MKHYTITYCDKYKSHTFHVSADGVEVGFDGGSAIIRFDNPQEGDLPRIVPAHDFQLHEVAEPVAPDNKLKRIRRALAGLPDSTTLAATIRQIVDEVPAMTEADMDKSTLDSIWLLQQGDPSGNDFDEKVRDLIARRNLFNQRSDEVRAAMACEIRREQKVSP